jgi:enamine deaminase RidA (YjgF/YER057c/UK114 family)
VSLPSERLSDLGLNLAAGRSPAAAYLSAVRFDDLVYTAGQVPIVDGTLRAAARSARRFRSTDAVECARIAALNALAAVVDLTGDLDVITRNRQGERSSSQAPRISPTSHW